MSTSKEGDKDGDIEDIEEEEGEILLEKDQPLPGTMTPEQIVEEYKSKGNPLQGAGNLSVEAVAEARRLWGTEGWDRKMISKQLKLGLNIVGACVRGIQRGIPPEGRIDIPGMIARAGIGGPRIESPMGKGTAVEVGTLQSKETPTMVPVPVIAPEALSSLYALAVQRGYGSLDQFILKVLIPWYGVMMKWEWRTGTNLTPQEFEKYIDDTSKKSALLDQIVMEYGPIVRGYGRD